VDFVSNSWSLANGAGVDSSPLVNVAKLKRSADILFLTEANASLPTDMFGYHDVFQPVHLPRGSAPRVADLKDRRHRGRLNICWMDGHVAPKFAKDITEADFRGK
jgi:prepilin-type processing-associated H-X9-DG protein